MKGKQDNIIEHTEILIDQVRLDSKLKVFLKAFESFSEKNSIFLKKKLSVEILRLDYRGRGAYIMWKYFLFKKCQKKNKFTPHIVNKEWVVIFKHS